MDQIKNDILLYKENETNFIKPIFKNTLSLNYDEFYKNSYNNIRRSKIILFNECLFSLNDIEKSNKNKLKIAKYNTKFRLINKAVKQYKSLDKMIDTILLYYSKIYYICNISKKIEIGCLNTSINKANRYNIRPIWENEQFVLLYHSICYRVSINLDEYSLLQSPYLKSKILSSEFNLYNVSSMTSLQLCPHKNQKIKNKVNKRNNINITLKYSEIYRCKKCKRNQTTTERRYNRSLDEGVNLTITCTFCGYQWNG